MKKQSFTQPVTGFSSTLFNKTGNCIIVTFFLFLSLGYDTGLNAQSKIKATGTGNTTGAIANLSVSNTTADPLSINAQTVFIPSDGKYQPYIGFIPEALVPPYSTTVIPVEGYCADVHTPPVPNGTDMPPLSKWIPVQDPAMITGPGTTNLIPRTPLPPFQPHDIPLITKSPAFTPSPESPTIEPGIIINWPETNEPVNGVINTVKNPEIFAPLLVQILEDIIDATNIILEDENFVTPFANNPEKERESVIQQTFWMVVAELSGDPYEKEDFTGKVIEQFESSTNTTVASLPEEQKEDLQSGINDFWSTFQATGVEAKVISMTSPDLELDDTEAQLISTTPPCECGHISFDLLVTRDGDEVHDETHTASRAHSTNGIRIEVEDFTLGDSFEISISNIRSSCYCGETACNFYPSKSQDSGKTGFTEPDTTKAGKAGIVMHNDAAGTIGKNGNNNCEHKNAAWNSDESEYTCRLITRDEKSNEKSVFQRLTIRTYCLLNGCRKTLCTRWIQLNFVVRQD